MDPSPLPPVYRPPPSDTDARLIARQAETIRRQRFWLIFTTALIALLSTVLVYMFWPGIPSATEMSPCTQWYNRCYNSYITPRELLPCKPAPPPPPPDPPTNPEPSRNEQSWSEWFDENMWL